MTSTVVIPEMSVTDPIEAMIVIPEVSFIDGSNVDQTGSVADQKKQFSGHWLEEGRQNR